MCCISVVHEALSGVNDQLERRTYSAYSLRSIIDEFKVLYGKLRLTNLAAILLESYFGIATPVSIFNFDDGKSNIYEILAIDTLNFARSARDCSQHEQRCQEIINKETGKTNLRQSTEVAPGTKTWHERLDSKWKDLLSIAAALGTDISTSHDSKRRESNGDTGRKRRPLLLYFPHHTSSISLSCHRTLLLAKRSSQLHLYYLKF
jgi:hypothetical protein